MGERDHRGLRTGIEERFVLVSDGYNNFYGGRQEWFSEEERPKFYKYGCGIIAAVNSYLYLAGINWITRVDYMILVREFVKKYPSSRLFLNMGIGVLPWQMSSYIKRKCTASGIRVTAHWHGREGIDTLYEKMKLALEKKNPVIWAFYNLNPTHKVQFYKYINGEFKDSYRDSNYMEHRYDGVNSHYVTVTAVCEREIDGRKERWVEISSWGSRYYVNYDEFLAFVKNPGGIFNPANIINGYCSNILIVHKR